MMGLELAESIAHTVLRTALLLAAGEALLSDSCTSLCSQEFITDCCKWETGVYALLGFWSFTGRTGH